jgi:1,4-dihydroxy-2-naphthoate octaprenyltransferase
MRYPEPSLAGLRNPLLRYFFATRPAFFAVTLFGVAIGLSAARYSGIGIRASDAALTLFAALLAHAGVNVLNDYYDALNGTDAVNTERLYPYTGGSRFIQNGVLTLRETAAFGAVLYGAVVLAGLWLAARSGPGLVAIGAAGLFVGWAYSAPPLALNSRGFGEPSVAAGFALLVVGSDYVQRGEFALFPLVVSASYALLVANVLYINQFPDAAADAAVGKRHWVVRLGAKRARWGYVAIALAAYGGLAAAVLAGALPQPALIALLPAVMSASAAHELWQRATEPSLLAPAIGRTIGAACAHGSLLALALALAR